MTKRQMLAECLRLAPDFRMTFVRGGDDAPDQLVAAFTDRDGLPPLSLGMTLGPEGRSKVESRLLEAALTRLKRSKAAA